MEDGKKFKWKTEKNLNGRRKKILMEDGKKSKWKTEKNLNGRREKI